ncbi:MAG: GAF domain-containing protein [Chlorobi bacterium]|nr:GAF domain-containing protein [Chlorobiota bacterium]
MKKLTLNNILFTGLGIIILFVIIFGTREIIYINGYVSADKTLQSIIRQEKTVGKLNDVFLSEQILIKNVINSENKNEISELQKKHMLNAAAFSKYKTLLKTDIAETENYSQNEKLQKTAAETENIYKKEIAPLITALIKTKENIIDAKNISGADTEHTNALMSNMSETENQIKETSRLIYENLNLIKQITEENRKTAQTEKEKFIRSAEINIFIFFILIIILAAIIYTISAKYVFTPLESVYAYIKRLTAGDLPEDLHLKSGKDITKITSVLNKTTAVLKNAVNFAKELAKGNFQTNFEPASDKDALGNTLLTLRDNIRKAQEEDEKRKKEEARRQKTNEGLTMFAEILRKHSDNLQNLADTVISSLVNFLNANQGALFFLNDEDPENIYYELIGAYAYNRKKYLTKHIKPGEGLVGAVALEKYTVYMTEVPEDYIEIESGTGKANPRSVLIVPLKIEENVLGIIELASFQKFKKEEIEMVEKIAESIASSLSNAKINMQTAKLLEKSRIQEMQMEMQEKELRQNIEELKKLSKDINLVDNLKAENNLLKVRLKRLAKFKEEADNLKAENEMLKVRLKRQSSEKDKTDLSKAEVEMLKVRLKRTAKQKEEIEMLKAENKMLKLRLKKETEHNEEIDRLTAENNMLKVRFKREAKLKDTIDTLTAENEMLKLRLKKDKADKQDKN